MKVKEILEKAPLIVDEDGETECELCHIHEAAYKLLPDMIQCPHCNSFINPAQFIKFNATNVPVTISDMTVVGGTNSVVEGEDMYKLIVDRCPHCKENIGLLPIKVIYNGGHDIYYTGADYYLDGEIEFNSNEIQRLIKNYTDRLMSGEDLNPSHLSLWITREIESNVAKYLFDRGLKFVAKENIASVS